MVNHQLKHSNDLTAGSRYSATFDLIMHDLCLKRFDNLLNGKHILELGCYHGDMTAKLAITGSAVTAVDVDPECIHRSQLTTAMLDNVDFLLADFADLAIPDAVEVVYFSHALEHVSNRASVLQSIANQLNGRILITIVPNGNSLSRRIAEKMGIINDRFDVTEFERSIGHHVTFSRSVLELELQQAGMEILDSGGVCPKIFSNNQFDRALNTNVIDLDFVEGLNELSRDFPDLCASVYAVTTRD